MPHYKSLSGCQQAAMYRFGSDGQPQSLDDSIDAATTKSILIPGLIAITAIAYLQSKGKLRRRGRAY